MIDFDRPDLLLAYIGGAAGRLLIHLIMLSDQVYTWNDEVESKLVQLPREKHSKFKIAYMKHCVFPGQLKTNHARWKEFEPGFWQAHYEPRPGQKFIRHAWMMEPLDTVLSYGASKVAYVNCKSILHFVLTAAIEKNAYALVYHNPSNGQGPGLWYKSSSELETKNIIKGQLHAYLDELTRWQSYRETYGFHEICLEDFLFATEHKFSQSYQSLCDFFDVTPQLERAIELRQHWLDLHDYDLDKPVPTFYDIAYHEFKNEVQQQGLSLDS